MRIAMIGHKRIPSREGGIEVVVDELSSRLVKLGFFVTAYNRDSAHVSGKNFSIIHKNEYNGVNLKWIKTPNSSKLNAIVYSFFATIHASLHNFDVIHFHAEGPSSMIPIAKLFKKKCVVTIHGLDWKRSKWGGFATKFLLYGEKTAAKYADEIIVLSKDTQDYFLKTYNRKTVLIPNGITISSPLSANIIDKKYGLKKDSYILYLGRLVPEKRIDLLIDAYNEIRTDKSLVIAGGSSHTQEYANLLKEKASNNKNIIFTDFVEGDTLKELYSNAYIYCLPSDIEGMPISLLEAMSYGCRVITSDISECTDVTKGNAISFKMGDAKDLKEKLLLLLNDNELSKKLGQNALKHVENNYNWDEIVSKTINIYN